ncbi:MAG: hypothetical protein H0U11_02440, partial [Chloroflexi bacterium]|nr:hypothetical protein [Chloroflexota bacterium]
VAEETVEQDAFEAMFADLPDPRKEAGEGGGMTARPLPSLEPRPEKPSGAPSPSPSPSPA